MPTPTPALARLLGYVIDGRDLLMVVVQGCLPGHGERHRVYGELVPSVQPIHKSLAARAIKECEARGALAPLLCTRIEDVERAFREFAAKCLEYEWLSVHSSMPEDLQRLNDAINALTPFVAAGTSAGPPDPPANDETHGGDALEVLPVIGKLSDPTVEEIDEDAKALQNEPPDPGADTQTPPETLEEMVQQVLERV